MSARRPRHEGMTADDIIDDCKQRLASDKYARMLEFRASLPKGPSGNLPKRE
jgi:acyl-CoA synthetase (AMP-forming)/AMP-acid ligase II